MLTSLVRLAKQFLEYEAKKEGVDPDLLFVGRLCLDPRKPEEDLKVLSVDPRRIKSSLEDYDDKRRWRYLYSLPVSKRGIGPSWLIRAKRYATTKESIEVGLREIGLGLRKLTQSSEGKSKWARDALEFINSNYKEILDIIEKQIPHEGCLLTVELDGRKGGDDTDVRTAFVKERLFGASKAESIGQGQCHVCGKWSEVSAAVPFRFFAIIDKPSFRPHGDETRSWTISPVCKDCTKWLYVSEDILKDQLSMKIAGMWAYAIPNFEPGDYDMSERFLEYLWHFREDASKNLVQQSEWFGEMVEKHSWKGPPPFRSVLLVFYQPGQKFLFTRLTAEILPNNLHLLSSELTRVRNALREGTLGQIGETRSKWVKGDLAFVGLTWRSQDGPPLVLDETDVVEAMLTRNTPQPRIFWSDVDRLLKSRYSEAVSGGQFSVKSSLGQAVIDIYIILILLYHNAGGQEGVESVGRFEPHWKEFFTDKAMLDTDAKRGYFLIGALFGRTEYAQRKERGSWKGEVPIMSRLRGFTIRASEISENLFPELNLKLRQLEANSKGIREIEAAASYYLSRDSRLSDEEARYYFSLGWALDYHTEKSLSGEKLSTSEKEATEEV